MHYEKTTISELEKGDVFIRVHYIENMKLSHFKCFAGKDSNGDYSYHYLSEIYWLALVDSSVYFSFQGEKKVYKFLRW